MLILLIYLLLLHLLTEIIKSQIVELNMLWHDFLENMEFVELIHQVLISLLQGFFSLWNVAFVDSLSIHLQLQLNRLIHRLLIAS